MIPLQIVLQEHDRVVPTKALPEHGLEPATSDVVHISAAGKAYEVGFVTLDGHTAAVCTVEAAQIRPASRRDIPHARELAAH